MLKNKDCLQRDPTSAAHLSTPLAQLKITITTHWARNSGETWIKNLARKTKQLCSMPARIPRRQTRIVPKNRGCFVARLTLTPRTNSIVCNIPLLQLTPLDQATAKSKSGKKASKWSIRTPRKVNTIQINTFIMLPTHIWPCLFIYLIRWPNYTWYFV